MFAVTFLAMKWSDYMTRMSSFKAKMHQIRFRLGRRPRARWGAYTASLAGFKRTYLQW